MILSFIDYEEAFDSVDRRALAKVLSLYGMPDKYIKVICAIYENTAALKVGNEVRSWFCIKSGVEQGCVLSPFILIILMEFVLRSTGKAIGDHGIKLRGKKTLLDFDYAGDLSILDKRLSKTNEFVDVLQVQGARRGLKINLKKTKSIRLGICEDEKVTLGNEKIDEAASLTLL